MFDSTITAKDLIREVKNEVDVALPVPDEQYMFWLNTAEQMLYSELIKELWEAKIRTDPSIEHSLFPDYSFQPPLIPEQEPPRFEDIYAVYAEKDGQYIQLIQASPAQKDIFPDCWYKTGQGEFGLGIHSENMQGVKLYYYVRPALKTEENYHIQTVKLPLEFIELIKAKLRAQAYKIENEFVLAQNWANDYNVLLEQFKVWIAGRTPTFGM